MRILLLAIVGLALASGDKLDRTYLPPPGSKFAGGSPGSLQVPFEYPKGSDYPSTGGSFDSESLDGSMFSQSERGEIPGFQQKGTIIQSIPQKPIIPTSKYSVNNLQNNYNIPSTTSSYDFTQSTTSPPMQGGSDSTFKIDSVDSTPGSQRFPQQQTVSTQNLPDKENFPQNQLLPVPRKELVNIEDKDYTGYNTQQKDSRKPFGGNKQDSEISAPFNNQLGLQNIPGRNPSFVPGIQISGSGPTNLRQPSSSDKFYNTYNNGQPPQFSSSTTISPQIGNEYSKNRERPSQIEGSAVAPTQTGPRDQYYGSFITGQPTQSQTILPSPTASQDQYYGSYDKNQPTLVPSSNSRPYQTSSRDQYYGSINEDRAAQIPSSTIAPSQTGSSDQYYNSFNSRVTSTVPNTTVPFGNASFDKDYNRFGNSQQALVPGAPDLPNKYKNTELSLSNSAFPSLSPSSSRTQDDDRNQFQEPDNYYTQNDTFSANRKLYPQNNIQSQETSMPSLQYRPTSRPISGLIPQTSQSRTPSNIVPSTSYSNLAGKYTTPTNILEKDQSIFISNRPERVQAEADRNAVILTYENKLTPEGFSYSFDTSNGIHAEENGTAIDGVKAQGKYSYTGDDGKIYSVVYSADENGFRPQGDHLPTPPPIPKAILRVIEQAYRDKGTGTEQDGSYDDAKYGYKKYSGSRDKYYPQESANSGIIKNKNRYDNVSNKELDYDSEDDGIIANVPNRPDSDDRSMYPIKANSDRRRPDFGETESNIRNKNRKPVGSSINNPYTTRRPDKTNASEQENYDIPSSFDQTLDDDDESQDTPPSKSSVQKTKLPEDFNYENKRKPMQFNDAGLKNNAEKQIESQYNRQNLENYKKTTNTAALQNDREESNSLSPNIANKYKSQTPSTSQIPETDFPREENINDDVGQRQPLVSQKERNENLFYEQQQPANKKVYENPKGNLLSKEEQETGYEYYTPQRKFDQETNRLLSVPQVIRESDRASLNQYIEGARPDKGYNINNVDTTPGVQTPIGSSIPSRAFVGDRPEPRPVASKDVTETYPTDYYKEDQSRSRDNNDKLGLPVSASDVTIRPQVAYQTTRRPYFGQKIPTKSSYQNQQQYSVTDRNKFPSSISTQSPDLYSYTTTTTPTPGYSKPYQSTSSLPEQELYGNSGDKQYSTTSAPISSTTLRPGYFIDSNNLSGSRPTYLPTTDRTFRPSEQQSSGRESLPSTTYRPYYSTESNLYPNNYNSNDFVNTEGSTSATPKYMPDNFNSRKPIQNYPKKQFSTTPQSFTPDSDVASIGTTYRPQSTYSTTIRPYYPQENDRTVNNQRNNAGSYSTIDRNGFPSTETPQNEYFETKKKPSYESSYNSDEQSKETPPSITGPSTGYGLNEVPVRIIGEDFRGPKQPQRYDPETGYHYK